MRILKIKIKFNLLKQHKKQKYTKLIKILKNDNKFLNDFEKRYINLGEAVQFQSSVLSKMEIKLK